MKVAIVGSRDFSELARVDAYVDALPADTVVVSGGARGVDRRAEQRARARGLEVVSLSADWARHGKRAGFLRNREIVATVDRVVAFWDGVSPGTASTIELARRTGKAVEIHLPSTTARTSAD